MKECENIIAKVLSEGRTLLLPDEAKQVCKLHKIPIPISYSTDGIEEALLKASEIGYPVVLKVISPKIFHKSDVGGVILNIKNPGELSIAYELMIQKTKDKDCSDIRGVLVEKMMPQSTELIVGGVKDSQFGASIMFGIGGIFTEIYNDVAFRVAPINNTDAWNLVHELKGSKLLQGVRGKPPVHLKSVINVLLRVSDMIVEHASINELDLNPLIAYANSVCAVDCRIVVKRNEIIS